jgi:hypothetical protein
MAYLVVVGGGSRGGLALLCGDLAQLGRLQNVDDDARCSNAIIVCDFCWGISCKWDSADSKAQVQVFGNIYFVAYEQLIATLLAGRGLSGTGRKP